MARFEDSVVLLNVIMESNRSFLRRLNARIMTLEDKLEED